MTYSVDVAFSPANELIVSLYTYLCKKSHKRIDLGSKWVNTTKKLFEPEFTNMLKDESILLPLHLLAVQCHVKNADGFLNWLEELSLGALYEGLSPWIQPFPAELGEKKDKIVTVLRIWNEHYFKYFDRNILSKLDHEVELQKKRIKMHDPVHFGEILTNGLHFNQTEGLEKVLFIPQFHSQPVHLFHYYGKITICQYSPFIFEQEEGEPSSELSRLTKAVSDQSRLKILRFLAKSESSFMDVFKHMGLAKSTVHDHLIILRTAGLIGVNIEGNLTSTYHFRKESLSQLKELLESFILKV